MSLALWSVSLLVAPAAWAWPDLILVKTGPAQAAPGDLVTYTLTYTNIGDVKSTSVVLKDFLPAYVAVLTNTLNGGFVTGNNSYKLNEAWGLFTGVQFHAVGNYSHRESGQTAVLNLGETIFLVFGASYSF